MTTTLAGGDLAAELYGEWLQSTATMAQRKSSPRPLHGFVPRSRRPAASTEENRLPEATRRFGHPHMTGNRRYLSRHLEDHRRNRSGWRITTLVPSSSQRFDSPGTGVLQRCWAPVGAGMWVTLLVEKPNDGNCLRPLPL